MGKFRWWKWSIRQCSVLDENRLKNKQTNKQTNKKQCGYNFFFKLTLINGDSSTTTMGSLGCGSGRTVTVRILELITAGGLQRHAQSHGQKECYFLRTGMHTRVRLDFFLWDFVKWWGKIRGICRKAAVFWYSSHTSTLGMYDNISTPVILAWNKPFWPTDDSLIISMQPDKFSLIMPSESVHMSRHNHILIPPSEGLYFSAITWIKYLHTAHHQCWNWQSAKMSWKLLAYLVWGKRIQYPVCRKQTHSVTETHSQHLAMLLMVSWVCLQKNPTNK